MSLLRSTRSLPIRSGNGRIVSTIRSTRVTSSYIPSTAFISTPTIHQSSIVSSTFRHLNTPSTTSGTVPVIDLTPSFTNDPIKKQQVADQIAQACRDIGFFTIVGHGIPTSLLDETWKITQQYFDLSTNEKLRIPMTADYPYGYSGYKEENLAAGYGVQAQPDLKECFAIGPINPAAGMPPVQWPTQPTQFKQIWCNYYHSMETLAAHLLSLFALGLKLPENWFADKITHHRSALRALNYPKPDSPPEPGQIRAGQHTDYGSLTILRQDQTGGLQVLNRAKQWQHVAPTPNSFIINLGDLMQRWTNDEWISTLHRVINPPHLRSDQLAERRQSMAFFHNLNADAIVECIPTCQSKDRPAKYKPIKAWDLLMEKHSASVGMEKKA